jgi:hypothetical protein
VTPLSPTENTDDKIDIDTFSENTRELKFVKSAFFVWAAKNQNISAFVIASSRFIIAFASVVTGEALNLIEWNGNSNCRR